MMKRLALLAVVLAAPAGAQTPAPPAAPAPASPQPAPAAPPPPAAWEPRGTVDLVVLDKVSAHATPISGKVGQPITFGSLTITARACDVRGPDAAPDATAFLDIVDSRGGVPEFHAWVLLSAPGVSVYEHPVYDVRLAGCR